LVEVASVDTNFIARFEESDGSISYWLRGRFFETRLLEFGLPGLVSRWSFSVPLSALFSPPLTDIDSIQVADGHITGWADAVDSGGNPICTTFNGTIQEDLDVIGNVIFEFTIVSDLAGLAVNDGPQAISWSFSVRYTPL
jgi:hypothetical protein